MAEDERNVLYIPRLHWYIPIFVDYSLIEPRFSVTKHFFLILNILTDLICAPLALYLTRQFYRSTVIHPSLKLVYVVHFCTYQVFCISSIVCLLHQGNYLTIPKTFPEDLLITIFGSHKMEYMWSQVLFTLVIVIERFVATIRMRKMARVSTFTLGTKYQLMENLHVFKTLRSIVGLSGFCLFSTDILITITRFIDISGPNGFWQIIICFVTELILTM
ncbi:unnamed protein product [Caenorhabditis auriculariae]|uniref:Uncharacterized protein n=1 Tax=Caenorhabditis auriculariae TaxID=2777116 RepID=A0A8S1GZS1_9PELO|nr:unnamed protein product [Caenorhabditis auriculariae]